MLWLWLLAAGHVLCDLILLFADTSATTKWDPSEAIGSVKYGILAGVGHVQIAHVGVIIMEDNALRLTPLSMGDWLRSNTLTGYGNEGHV